MIEAINSVVSNAPFNRAETQKVDVAAAPPPSAEVEPSIIPDEAIDNVLATFDNQLGQTVTQVLNPQSGQVLLQFPSETRLEAEASQREQAEAASAELLNSAPQSTGGQPVITSFDVYDSPSELNGEIPPNPAQAAIAINALNEAAQSGTAALSSVSVSA